jgi:hypothetical protein
MEKTGYIEVLENILKALVNYPNEVKLEKKIDEMGVLVLIKLHPQDVGLVIGKKGSMIKALRTVIKAIGLRNHARVNIKVEEPTKKVSTTVDEVLEDLKK